MKKGVEWTGLSDNSQGHRITKITISHSSPTRIMDAREGGACLQVYMLGGWRAGGGNVIWFEFYLQMSPWEDREEAAAPRGESCFL